MKITNFYGENMPILPWMINFDCPKKQCFKQNEAANANNSLQHQANLSVNSKCANYMLTSITCSLSINNNNAEFIENLLKENVRSFCIDTSRGTESEHIELINTIRDVVESYSKNCGRQFPVCISLELTGLRIRTGYLDSNELCDILLEENKTVYITTNDNYGCHCNKHMIFVNYKNLLKILKPGNLIFIDYGTIILEVLELGKTKMHYNQIKCKVINGGKLRDLAIIHLPHIPHNFQEEIKVELIRFALAVEIDAIIISHIYNAHDLKTIRQRLGEEGNGIMILTKIDTARSVENINEIIELSDGIVISRGELGIELPSEKLFLTQKLISAKCNQVGKPIICAGHFVKSMYKNHLPTRAEMLDAANVVLDGTDGILLTEEIINSPNIFEAIHNLQNICLESEAAIFQKEYFKNLTTCLSDFNEPIYSVAISAVDCSMRCNAACIIIQTVSGRCAKLISQIKPQCPIIAVTKHGHVARKLNLWRGVIPVHYIGAARKEYLREIDYRFCYAITFGKKSGLIHGGDRLILVSGWKECSGFTNTIRIVYASDNNSLYLTQKPCQTE